VKYRRRGIYMTRKTHETILAFGAFFTMLKTAFEIAEPFLNIVQNIWIQTMVRGFILILVSVAVFWNCKPKKKSKKTTSKKKNKKRR